MLAQARPGELCICFKREAQPPASLASEMRQLQTLAQVQKADVRRPEPIADSDRFC